MLWESYYFFCGQRRLNEIPERLSGAAISYKEVIVYETELTPQTLEKTYEGILFYSPSGVESFFSANHPGKATLFFNRANYH
ncbi:MAG: uroporphyrinogen-III synthase [Tannerellaceae bacterium]|nr:uroporphyrinogen-III synthase [Tannerellaceae bacterium]